MATKFPIFTKLMGMKKEDVEKYLSEMTDEEKVTEAVEEAGKAFNRFLKSKCFKKLVEAAEKISENEID